MRRQRVRLLEESEKYGSYFRSSHFCDCSYLTRVFHYSSRHSLALLIFFTLPQGPRAMATGGMDAGGHGDSMLLFGLVTFTVQKVLSEALRRTQ